ncbi:MAG: CPBP family intramembrane metalloprotease [Myxococcales bacterium]|nr:CPBP family intramembrane metalloprotease [Myxococcales bacterium]
MAVTWGALRGHPNILLMDGSTAGLKMGHLLSSVALGGSMGLLLVLLTRYLQENTTWAQTLHNEFRHVLGPLCRRDILVVSAASAIGEECLFRGALLQHILQALPGPLGMLLGLIGSALLFSLLHIGPSHRFVPWTLSALVMGLMLGGLLLLTGDLLAPIAVHFTVNLLNLSDIVRRELPHRRTALA